MHFNNNQRDNRGLKPPPPHKKKKMNNLRIATTKENQEYERLMKVQKQKELAYYEAQRNVFKYIDKMQEEQVIINGK